MPQNSTALPIIATTTPNLHAIHHKECNLNFNAPLAPQDRANDEEPADVVLELSPTLSAPLTTSSSLLSVSQLPPRVSIHITDEMIPFPKLRDAMCPRGYGYLGLFVTSFFQFAIALTIPHYKHSTEFLMLLTISFLCLAWCPLALFSLTAIPVMQVVKNFPTHLSVIARCIDLLILLSFLFWQGITLALTALHCIQQDYTATALRCVMAPVESWAVLSLALLSLVLQGVLTIAGLTELFRYVFHQSSIAEDPRHANNEPI